MAARLDSDAVHIFAAALLRALALGMTAVILALHLNALGWNAARIGLFLGLGFAGAAAATLWVGFLADRAGRRRTLLALAGLSCAGALVLATTTRSAWLLLAAFVGMLNGLGRPRGGAYALEQAILPETTSAQGRTRLLAWYEVAMNAGVGLGSLLAVLPSLLRRHWGWSKVASYHAAWWIIVSLFLAAVPLYSGLSGRVEILSRAPEEDSVSTAPRRRVRLLASLMALDAFGGGMLTNALLAYWFFKRFHVGEEWLGPIFLAARVANLLSQPVAAWLSRKIGLVNTMVFTHIPSSLILMGVAFAPRFAWAAGLYLARESLVQMDVPARQSYLLALVSKPERSYASGLTAFTRNGARILGSTLSGYVMSALSLSSPLLLGGGSKILYDLLLYACFRRLKPPEEAASAAATPLP